MPHEPLTIRQLLARTTPYLEEKGSASARLDAEVLLAEVLSTDRLHLYLDMDRPLDEEELARYREFVRRRAAREPIAYILGYREFYGLPFEVDSRTLIPRPETEGLVEAALACMEKITAPRVIDLGTGSGAIALTLTREREDAQVYATDISEGALDVARHNALQLGVSARVTFAQGDLFAGVEGPFDVIVSNPPYVPDADRATMQPDVRDYEPASALFAGVDGLDVIRQIVALAPSYLREGGSLLFEIGYAQEQAVRALIEQTEGLQCVEIIPDLQRIPRIAVANYEII